jgi:DNA-binding transcriptional ArsR family regulator
MVHKSSAPGLTKIFAALADPTRRAILTRLASGEMTVAELAKPFAISGPGISKHLKVLEHAGLIARRRNAQQRPCRLVARPLREANDWLEQYRQLWEASLDKLETYLSKVQSKEKRRAQRRKT